MYIILYSERPSVRLEWFLVRCLSAAPPKALLGWREDDASLKNLPSICHRRVEWLVVVVVVVVRDVNPKGAQFG